MAHTSTLSKFIDRHAYKLAMGMTALGVALLSSALTSALVGDRGLVPAIGDQLAGLRFWAEAPARIDAAPKVAGMPRYLNRELLRETTGTYLGLEFDRLPWAASIRSGGAQFKRGIAMHAPPTGTASATFSIPTGASHFVALVGLADGAEGGAACVAPGGSVRFAIRADGLSISDPIESSGSPGATHRLRIALPAFARSLTLAVDNLDGSNRCDSAVWLEARFDALGKFPTEVAALRDPPAPVVAEPTQVAEELAANPTVTAEKKPMPQPVIELVDAQSVRIAGTTYPFALAVSIARITYGNFAGNIIIRVPDNVDDQVTEQLLEQLGRLGVGRGYQIETGRPTSTR